MARWLKTGSKKFNSIVVVMKRRATTMWRFKTCSQVTTTYDSCRDTNKCSFRSKCTRVSRGAKTLSSSKRTVCRRMCNRRICAELQRWSNLKDLRCRYTLRMCLVTCTYTSSHTSSCLRISWNWSSRSSNSSFRIFNRAHSPSQSGRTSTNPIDRWPTRSGMSSTASSLKASWAIRSIDPLS